MQDLQRHIRIAPCVSIVRLGSVDNERPILVNSETFQTQNSLWNFPFTTRQYQRSSSRLCWIDTITIDQNNIIAERNYQVRQMGSIYSQAQEVHVWFGLSAP